MQISVISYSLSEEPTSLVDWKQKILDEILSCAEAGSSIVLYPELFLMGLAKFLDCKPEDQLKQVAELISSDILPFFQKALGSTDILLVFGSGPRYFDSKIFNSCPILHKGSWRFQDKLYLTPWETDFIPGQQLHVFEFAGLKCAVVICFDSEQPDISLKLKHEGVDLILIPSATTNRNGNQRVNRCASARSVELGAVVVTSPLVGDSIVDLIDHNEGRQGFFLPAQESITSEQEQYSVYSSSESVLMNYTFQVDDILELKKTSSETRPFLKKTNGNILITKI